MTAPLTVLIVDDEPLARAGLAGLLARDADVEVVGECGDGRSAAERIRSLRPDLVILDVQMPEMNGFDVIRAVGPEQMPPVVFVTAYDRFAVKAFEVHALDYLLKPFDDERFLEAIDRAKRSIRQGGVDALSRRLLALLGQESARPSASPPDGSWLTRIVVKKPGSTFLLSVDDIDWIESADYCVRIHSRGKTHVVREAMTRLEQRLDPRRFFRAHRSGIVNLDRIKEVQPAFHGDLLLILHDGSQVKLSRSRRAALEERLGQGL